MPIADDIRVVAAVEQRDDEALTRMRLRLEAERAEGTRISEQGERQRLVPLPDLERLSPLLIHRTIQSSSSLTLPANAARSRAVAWMSASATSSLGECI